MPQGMEARVFRSHHRLPVVIHYGLTLVVKLWHADACRDLQRVPSALDYVLVAFDLAFPVGEDKLSIALGARELPFAECFDDYPGQRDRAVAAIGLWTADFTPSVRALAHGDGCRTEINIRPAQPAELG